MNRSNLADFQDDSKASSSMCTFSHASKLDTSFSFSNASIRPESDKVGHLFHSFIDAHTKLLKEIDESDWDDIQKLKEKVRVLESYTRQLAEQNEVLVKSIEELEREAERRAIQLETRLKRSARTTKEAVLRLHEYEQDMRNLLRENVRKNAALEDILSQLSSLKVENSFLRDQNANLRHDIKALLHIIHQARSTGHWELDCVTFCEVTPEQVFGPVHPLSQGLSRDSLGWQDLTVPYRNGNQGTRRYSMSERSSCLTSHHSSFSNLPDADISPVEHYNDRDIVCSRLEGELRHLRQWREDAQLELLEKDKLIAALESQISTLNHEIMVKQAECDYHMIDINLLKQQAKAEQRRESDGGAPLLPAHEHHTFFRDARSYPCGIDCMGFLAENYMFPKCLQDAAIQVNIIRSSHCASCQTESSTSSPVVQQQVKLARTTNMSPSSLLSTPVDEDDDDGYPQEARNVCDTCPACLEVQEDVMPPTRKLSKRLKNQRHSSSDETFTTRWKHSDICLVLHNDAKADNVSRKTNCVSTSAASTHSLEQFCVFDDLTSESSRKDAHSLEDREAFSSDDYQKVEIPNDQVKPTSPIKALQIVTCNMDVQTDPVSAADKQLQIDMEVAKTDSSVQSDLGGSFEANDNSAIKMANEDGDECYRKLKALVRKAEDKATSKEMLVIQLQKHLENAVKEVTLKDTALENAERKLAASREECSRLNSVVVSMETEIEKLHQDIEDLKKARENLQKNVDAREEQIQELKNREETHQEQKRILMIQLDEQGEKLMKAEDEVAYLRAHLDAKIKKEIDGQAETIRYLQEALVQTKMALEEAQFVKMHNNNTTPSRLVKANSNGQMLRGSQIIDV